MPRQRKPSYLLHRPSGQARVRIKGKDHYLGRVRVAGMRELYDDLIVEWFGRGDAGHVTLKLDDLALLYVKHAEQHYRKHGRPTSELSCIKTAIRYVIRLYGTSRVRDFGPRALKAVRDAMIADGHCRRSINKHIGRIRRLFRWGVENEYVPSEVYGARSGSARIASGSLCGRRDRSSPAGPNCLRRRRAALRQSSGLGGDSIAIAHRHEAGRGSCNAWVRSQHVRQDWEYRPSEHKGEHHGQQRVVFIGPQAAGGFASIFEAGHTGVCVFSSRCAISDSWPHAAARPTIQP